MMEGNCPSISNASNMNVTYLCPECEKATRASLDQPEPIRCVRCQHELPVDSDALDTQRLKHCVVCGGRELYVRKDFPQRLGVAIIVVGMAAAMGAVFLHHHVIFLAILIGLAAIDAVLYSVTGNALHCYRCHSEYRGLQGLERFNPFDLEIHERHRQQQARLGDQRPSGIPE